MAKSPPLEFIQPIGQGHQFHFTRPQSGGEISHHSSTSGHECPTSPQPSGDESESDQESNDEDARPMRRVEKADFVLEELDSDSDYDSDTPVLRPDQYEDAVSEKNGGKVPESVIGKFSELRCDEDSADEDEQARNYRRKKKRWSAGIFKRSHSQSVGSDSDDSAQLDAHDVGSSARRLRRRVRGPEDRRSSLIFEDGGFPNIRHIVEVEEPEDGIRFSRGPPSIPSDDGFTLDELPFYVYEGPMDFEVESYHPA